MPSNAQARLRNSFYQVPDARPSDEMPDWLRSQFSMTGAGGGGDAGDGQEQWLSPGHIVRDAQGRRVVMLGDNRQLEHTNDLAMNPDYNPETDAYFDPDLGWVADGSKVNDSPWQQTHSRNRGIAAGILGSMVAGGLASEAGLFGGEGGWGGDFGAGGLDPETLAGAGGMGDGGAAAGGGMAFEQSPIPDMGDLFPNGLPSEGTFADTGWVPESAPSGSWLTPQNIARGVNGLRSILGGGGGSGGAGAGGGGGMGVMGGFGAAPRIGDHRQDNDPYGLAASGWKGGMLAQPDAKQRIAQALMGENPWRYEG